jgi:hypothetical protein
MSYKFQDAPARKPYEEPGEYLVTVEEFEHKFSTRGEPMILLKLRTSGGALVFDNMGVLTEDADPHEEAVFNKKWGWKVDPMVGCFFRLKKGDEVALEKEDWCKENLIGKSGWVLLSKEQTNTGKTRNTVDAYLPPKKNGAPVPGTTTKASTPVSATSAASASPAKQAAPVEDDDDNIPF